LTIKTMFHKTLNIFRNGRDTIGFLKKYGILFVLMFMIFGITIVRPVFLTSTNILNVLTQTAIFGIMSLGMTLVIISKGIDLSVGSVLALAGVVAASLGQAEAAGKFFPHLPQLPVFVPILAALAIGGIIGATTGGVIACAKIPPFIATLGMMTIARGITLLYTDGRPISSLSSGFTAIGGNIGMIPVPVLIYLVVVFVTWVLLNNTRFGKHVYAIGGNVKAAEVSGVNIKKNLIMIYAFSGLLAGIAAIVFAGRV